MAAPPALLMAIRTSSFSTPGTSGIGTNPEQLFAVAWSACFESAIALAARKKKRLPADVAIDAEVDLNLADAGYLLRTRLNISLPGVEREAAQALVDEAHEICCDQAGLSRSCPFRT
jgi:lipoyl-dependent peroxiredoxin